MALPTWLVISFGVLVHHGVFIRGEWHLRAPVVIMLHSTSIFVAGCAMRSLLEPIRLFTLYSLGLFGSIGIYRIFFHRLRSFPGPQGAALSKLWHIYQCRNSQNHLVLDSLYKKYGEIVRTGPNELTIFHPAAFEAIDGAGNSNIRADWYDIVYPRISPIFSRAEKDHLERRRAWTHALSLKSINDYLPRIRRQISSLEHAIEKHDGQPIVVNDIMQWFAFDSMGEFAFNEDLGMLKTSTWHSAISQQRSALALLGPSNVTVWPIRVAMAFVPFLPGVKDWNNMIAFCDSCMEKRLKSEVNDPDIATHFIREMEHGAATKSLRMRQNLLSGNTISLIVGGSDTTGPSLTLLWFFLARYPEHAEKIHQELMLATNPLDIRNTKITAPRYTIFRMEKSFEKPLEFIPERWYSQPELIKDRRAFAPFGVGRRACVGKNLALIQIRLLTSALLLKYRVRFAPGETGVAVEDNMKDQLTAQPGKFYAIFEKRISE
ncbi:cytochrome P450 [Glonium stellatum]|uniref:Cytochrome P450 n=1 Tax=Glonium stellatum TaxID=574774 RepID=A0A8E2EST8_9PEZI|nr:cytochrome P450 [Glonium stellatum]